MLQVQRTVDSPLSVQRRARPLPLSQYLLQTQWPSFWSCLQYIPTALTFASNFICSFPTLYIYFLTFQLQVFLVVMPPVHRQQQPSDRFTIPSVTSQSVYDLPKSMHECHTSISVTASPSRSSTTPRWFSKQAICLWAFVLFIYMFPSAAHWHQHILISLLHAIVPHFNFNYG